MVDSNASDARLRYRPLFSDTSVDLDESYYYRVAAKNASGISEPSEMSNPVVANNRIMIDEFENDAHLFSHSVGVTFLPFGRVDRTKEDWSLLHGAIGDYIVYRLPERIDSLYLDAFFTTAGRDSNIEFSTGISPENCSSITSTREVFEPYKNEYGAYAACRYILRNIPTEHRFIKINLADNVELSRIEISYGSMK
jgi:hypothetical protein